MWQTVPAQQIGRLVPAGGPVVNSVDGVMNRLPEELGHAADHTLDSKSRPIGTKGVLGLVPTGLVPSKGLSLGR
ncbi:hypothetical protein [Streptomyces sp. ICBB 8177]|uniref:hypothetical protein n=1 Tax=Streptomyces sp. ICBB 8177 TaxID=563922 RepID=UPI000D672D3B|nr:hypothetical protein [Streptomyces sp. ICBB 8177]PWI45048.1 hypothetical protein CK485_07715 [Streptomyces sp. ICBB 8177]